MRPSDFDFHLPTELIAQTPLPSRDASRLLALHRDSGAVEHKQFRDLLDFMRPGDVVVLNNSKVIPARLRGANARSGGKFEMLLLEENAVNDWWAMLRPGKRARIGTQMLVFDRQGQPSGLSATVLATNEEGHRRLRFEGAPNVLDVLDTLGEVPLPPYIERVSGVTEQDGERYQTVFAQSAGSVAAPTAGLHFTKEFLDELSSRGSQICFVTLHVGLGTFAPVKAETLSAHTMHEERYEIPDATALLIDAAKREGRRVVAIGTTTLRVLESVGPQIPPGSGRTRIFIYPPFEFKVVDALLTNFHLPRSTLLMLVSAFAAPKDTRGRDLIMAAYSAAIEQKYRFFSYGDAMLLA